MNEKDTATTILEKTNDEQLDYILELIQNFIDKRGD